MVLTFILNVLISSSASVPSTECSEGANGGHGLGVQGGSWGSAVALGPLLSALGAPQEIREIETDCCKESNDCTGPGQDSGGQASVSESAVRSLATQPTAVLFDFVSRLQHSRTLGL